MKEQYTNAVEKRICREQISSQKCRTSQEQCTTILMFDINDKPFIDANNRGHG